MLVALTWNRGVSAGSQAAAVIICPVFIYLCDLKWPYTVMGGEWPLASLLSWEYGLQACSRFSFYWHSLMPGGGLQQEVPGPPQNQVLTPESHGLRGCCPHCWLLLPLLAGSVATLHEVGKASGPVRSWSTPGPSPCPLWAVAACSGH